MMGFCTKQFGYYLLQKTDSGDSGNEEPNVESDFYSKVEDSFSVQSVARVPHMQPVVPAVHKPDRLAERINSLSHAQDYRLEKIPDGLIDSLPTEGLSKVLSSKIAGLLALAQRCGRKAVWFGQDMGEYSGNKDGLLMGLCSKDSNWK